MDRGCTGARRSGRSRMRQDKLTGSLRRGGRCLKRQGGGSSSISGGGGGVGTILSNVLKKRSCISRTAPRLLCTLEPGEDPGLQMGHRKVARRLGSWCCSCLCFSWTLPRPGSTRGPLAGGYCGLAQAGLGQPGRADRRPGPGRRQRPPKARRTRSSNSPRAPTPAACAWSCAGSWGSAGACPGYRKPRNQLCARLTRNQTLKEVCEVEKGTGLIVRV